MRQFEKANEEKRKEILENIFEEEGVNFRKLGRKIMKQNKAKKDPFNQT